MKTNLYSNSGLKFYPMCHPKLLFLLAFSFITHLLSAQIVIDLPGSYSVCAGESVQLIPTISGGDGEYTFLWSPSEGLSAVDVQSPIASTSSTLTYTLEVSDGGGLQASASTIVNLITGIEFINTFITDVDCNGTATGAINLTITGGTPNYTYAWSNLAITEDINNLPAGTYTVTITDAIGCETSASFTIDEPDELIIDLEATTITNADCNGATTGSIDLIVTGGTPPYAYLWSNGETVDNPSNLGAATYTVIVTDAEGCTNTTTLTINEPSPLSITSEITNAACSETNGAIDLTVTGGGAPYQYVWSNGAINEDISNLAAGIYYITVLDANDCTAFEEIQVNNDTDLMVDAGPDVAICEGESVNLNALATNGTGAYTYIWSHSLGSGADKTVSPIATTNYRVTVTDIAGCINFDEITVNVSSLPVIQVNIISPICNGDPNGEIWVINPGPNLSYSWSNGAIGSTINNLIPGTYCVTATDFNGCEASECFIINEPSSLIIDITGLPDNNCESDYTVAAIVIGGTAPYTYLWAGPDGFSATTSILQGSQLINGTYSLIITDTNGCVLVESIEINNQVSVVLNALPLNCNTGTTTIYSTGSATGLDYLYEWTGPEGFTSSDPDITVSVVGEYTLTITNTTIADCSSSTSITIFDPEVDLSEGIGVDIYDCNAYSLYAILPFDIFIPIDILWTFPDGSISTDESILPTGSGLYTLSVSIPELNCAFYSSYYVDFESDNCSSLEGYIRYDESEDCIADAIETGLQNIIVTATNATHSFNAITNEEGYYRFNLPSDNYIVTASLPTPSWIACEENYTIDLAIPGTIGSLNIPFQGEGLCPELSVSLTSPQLRRCFGGWYYLTICNEGTETASFPEVSLVLDDYLDFNYADIDPIFINGQQINWVIDEIGVGECTSITIRVTVNCDAILGQTHCSEAFASNYPFCGDGEEWSGANLELMASCDGDDVIFNVRNTGIGDLNETVNYIVIEDGVAMMEAVGTINNLPSSSDTEFNFPANGSTYTFMLDQAADHPYTLSITNSIEGCGTNADGDFSIGFVNQFSQQTATPTSTIFCLENIGSYDPNDKTAIPVGYGDSHYIEPEDKLNYRIRFQNTGTDTAFTVVVRDTLSDFLDIRSFERGSSSHDYELAIFGEQILSFTFNNILLVDSFANEEASHGFVDFSIRPKFDTSLETVIENKAAIFFDFNEPVITNTVFHTLGRDFYEIVNWKDLSNLNLSLEIFPNPSSQSLSILLKDSPATGHILHILDMNGHLVFQGQFNERTLLLNIQSWPSSWYAIQLFNNKGQLIGSGKLVKQ